MPRQLLFRRTGAIMIPPDILIVDDRPENRRLFAEIFRGYLPGCSVRTAGGGREAIALAAQKTPDCALVDVQMPGMSGLEVCRAFRQREDTPRFPVVMITGENSTTAFRAQCLEAGADDFISRPVENTELIARIRVMLRIKRAEEELRAANRDLEKRVEDRTRALEESRNDLQRVIDALPEALIVVEPDYTITHANRAARELRGNTLRPEGRCCFQVLWGNMQSCAEAGHTCPMNQVLRTSVPVTWVHRKPDAGGRQRFYEVSAAPVFNDEGRITRIIESCRDITSRYETQEALRQSEERLELAMYGAQLGMWDWDVRSDQLTYNKHWAQMLGFSLDEITPDQAFFESRLHPDDKTRVLDELARHIAGKTDFYESEHRLRRRDGEYIHVLDRGRIVEKDRKGAVCRVCGTVRDITERKHREEEARIREQQLIQADKMISLGILVSGVAHEINNPNHFILSNAAPLEDLFQAVLPVLDRYASENGDFSIGGIEYSQIRGKVPDMFRNIREGSKRIQLIVGELRQFATGSPKDTLDQVQINEIAASAITLLSNMIRKHTRVFAAEYDDNAPLFSANYHRLEQVLINLVQNACQALTDMDQAIRVKTAWDAGAQLITLAVEDEGCGMAAEILGHITDPFYTTRREAGGTGLGLSIAASIVREHGGRLEFTSTPGKGTAALVTLPADRAAGHRPVP
jgi:PAS domain S-box-containing protein